ncbi:glutaredoxin [Methanomicrobiaceae archaeon CYW5]|uniref:FAD-dependent oxidoreductase n=1 Tax=Methanovulcanius yangii TaxID=1789227 RepID=UPI0029CA45D4|nr:FAD-dependent oxidoreductase [Methanovulcanius yangii]MBT8508377.1 glutaredoxin [Methanovulcanius yangii]
MPKVTIYTTANCQYCRLTKAFFQKHGVEYEEIDVGTDTAAAAEMVEKSGQYGVPVTIVDGEVIVGFDAARFNEIFGEGGRRDVYDLLIIGGGPAGLTAAMYGARKMLSVLVVTENIGGQALESWSIENYMGFRLVTGAELMDRFEEKVREEGIAIELDSVSSVQKRDDGTFAVKTASDQEFAGRALVITSGAKPRWLGLPDEQKYIGRGESVCSTCDGPLFRGKDVAIVGGGNYALTTAIEMSPIARSVFLIVRSKIRADEVYTSQLKGLKNLTILQNYVVTGLSGESLLKGITVTERDTGEEQTLPVEGLFLAIGHEPNNAFLDGFVDLTDHGEIVVDINCHTSQEGVFAAGDVTAVKAKQIIVASGEGAKAALEAYEYLGRLG